MFPHRRELELEDITRIMSDNFPTAQVLVRRIDETHLSLTTNERYPATVVLHEDEWSDLFGAQLLRDLRERLESAQEVTLNLWFEIQ